MSPFIVFSENFRLSYCDVTSSQEYIFGPLGMKGSFYLTPDLKENYLTLTLRTEDGMKPQYECNIIEQDPTKGRKLSRESILPISDRTFSVPPHGRSRAVYFIERLLKAITAYPADS